MAHSTVELDPLHELTSTTPPAPSADVAQELTDADIGDLLSNETPAALVPDVVPIDAIEEPEPVAAEVEVPPAPEPEPAPEPVAIEPAPTPPPPPAKPKSWGSEFLLGDDPPPLRAGAKPVWQTNAAFSIPSVKATPAVAAATAATAAAAAAVAAVAVPVAVPTPVA